MKAQKLQKYLYKKYMQLFINYEPYVIVVISKWKQD